MWQRSIPLGPYTSLRACCKLILVENPWNSNRSVKVLEKNILNRIPHKPIFDKDTKFNNGKLMYLCCICVALESD